MKEIKVDIEYYYWYECKLNILISFWILKNKTQILDEQMIRIDIILSYLQTPLVWNIAISLFNHAPQTQNIIKMRTNTQNILYLKTIFFKKKRYNWG